jgi:hypothetical protein
MDGLTVMIQTDELELSSLDARYHEDAMAAFDARDGAAFASAGQGAAATLTTLLDNWKLLELRGMCESALTEAVFSGGRSNPKWGMGVLEKLFASLNRKKLLTCGDPLPEAQTFVLYRGVSGTGQQRQIRGLCWTSSFDVACWFADRSRDFGDPGVYSAVISRNDVYVYSRRHGREDFLVRPRSVRRLSVAIEDLRERHARVEAAWEGACSPLQEEVSNVLCRAD